MTSWPDLHLAAVLESVNDPRSVDLVQRVVQAEVTYHESRLAQLKELDKALGARAGQLGKKA